MAIDHFEPSRDGRFVALGMSSGGSESSMLTVIDTATGRTIAGPLRQGPFTDTSWDEDGVSLFFNRMPDPATVSAADRYKNSEVLHWGIGQDPRVVVGAKQKLGPNRDPVRFSTIATPRGTDRALLIVANGVENEIEVWEAPRADAARGPGDLAQDRRNRRCGHRFVRDAPARVPADPPRCAELQDHEHYLIDVKHAVIVDVKASTAVRQAEVTAAKRMIEQVHDDLGIWPRKLIGDTSYGSAETLAWLDHERDIEPHIPVFDKSSRTDATFSRADFSFDHGEDTYTCPAGKLLKRRRRRFADRPEAVPADGLLRYSASMADCTTCALKPQCCPGQPMRKVMRSIHNGARNLARALAEEDEWLVSRKERKKVEMLFAHSNASSGSTACDYAVPMVPETSSTSPPQPRTSASSPSSSQCRTLPVPA